MLSASSNVMQVAASLGKKAELIAKRTAARRTVMLAKNLLEHAEVAEAGIAVSKRQGQVHLRGQSLHRKLIDNPDLRDLKRHLI